MGFRKTKGTRKLGKAAPTRTAPSNAQTRGNLKRHGAAVAEAIAQARKPINVLATPIVKNEDAMPSAYSILGINNSSNDTEIKEAFHKLAKRWHPDKNQVENSDEACAKFAAISAAYAAISNTSKRVAYNNKIFMKQKVLNPSKKSSNSSSKSEFYDTLTECPVFRARRLLTTMWKRCAPEKADPTRIENVLKKYKGKESKLVVAVAKKYSLNIRQVEADLLVAADTSRTASILAHRGLTVADEAIALAEATIAIIRAVRVAKMAAVKSIQFSNLAYKRAQRALKETNMSTNKTQSNPNPNKTQSSKDSYSNRNIKIDNSSLEHINSEIDVSGVYSKLNHSILNNLVQKGTAKGILIDRSSNIATLLVEDTQIDCNAQKSVVIKRTLLDKPIKARQKKQQMRGYLFRRNRGTSKSMHSKKQ